MPYEEAAESSLCGRLLSIGLGTPLQLRLGGMDEHLKSFLVGMEPYKYLISRIPIFPGVAPKLYVGNRVTVRYIYSGTVYGFHTSLVHHVVKPDCLLFLVYPKTIEVLNLRRSQRVDCLLPATVELQRKKYPAVILDISMGGCRFSVERTYGAEPPTISLGERIALSYNLPGVDGMQTSCGYVRSMRLDGNRAEIGIQFDESCTEAVKNLEIYLNSVGEISCLSSGGPIGSG